MVQYGAGGFRIGDKVRWTSHDADIAEGAKHTMIMQPADIFCIYCSCEGEVGSVLGFKTNGRVRVQFGDRRWTFPPKQLRLAPVSKPPLPDD